MMRTLSLLILATVNLGVNSYMVQQGSKLVGTGYSLIYPQLTSSEELFLGEGVAIGGATGDTLAVSALGDYPTGAAWIFTRSGTTWTQQGSKITGTGYTGYGPQQGDSVALNADTGNTLAVGGAYDSSGNDGATWIFTRSGSTWTQQGSKLVGSPFNQPQGYQGISVALSGNGDILAVGAMGDEDFNNNIIGATWIFARSSNGVWSQNGTKLVGTTTSATVSQGSSVSLSGAGDLVAIGGPGDASNMGAAWVFKYKSGTWTQQGSKLVGNGTQGTTVNQGSSVALSYDGKTLAVGGRGDNSNTGAVWIFSSSDGGATWSQYGAKLTGSNSGGAQFGYSVSLNADGSRLAVGGQGAVWTFMLIDSVWVQTGNQILGSGNLGSSIAMSMDGQTMVSGAPYDNGEIGSCSVYTWIPPTSNPSRSPTHPTRSPSRGPSKTPTTSRPSQTPSRAPSKSPSTSHPSRNPSRAPSSSPTTSKPSKSPSHAPSRGPSRAPSRVPSRTPSRMPSRAPRTSKPSSHPTRPSIKSPSFHPSSQSPTSIGESATALANAQQAAQTNATVGGILGSIAGVMVGGIMIVVIIRRQRARKAATDQGLVRARLIPDNVVVGGTWGPDMLATPPNLPKEKEEEPPI